MMADKQNATDEDPSREALDAAFETLANGCRRTVIEELEESDGLTLDELTTRVAERSDHRSTDDAEIALVHNHLPKLEDAGVVRDEVGRAEYELVEGTLETTVWEAIRTEL